MCCCYVTCITAHSADNHHTHATTTTRGAASTEKQNTVEEKDDIWEYHNGAELIVINHNTGTKHNIFVTKETSAQLDNTIINLVKCFKQKKDVYHPDSRALVEIITPSTWYLNSNKNTSYHKWLFSNYRSLSRLFLSNYFIYVNTCYSVDDQASQEDETSTNTEYTD